MSGAVKLPEDFAHHLAIDNAASRFAEAREVAEKTVAAGIPLFQNLDHAAIFTDPPHLVSGPLKELGYVNGWDARCYPSPVDGCDYINVSAKLSKESRARDRGWFDHVAVVHPVDHKAPEKMLSHGYGNPFLHHVTWGIVPPERQQADDFSYAARLVPFMVQTRDHMASVIGEHPGTLILALPSQVIGDSRFGGAVREWLGGTPHDEFQIETMQGGGFLLQFFVLQGGRIEVALRVDTEQTFNPKSVRKISTDEISTNQGNVQSR